jgi:Zn-dependent protease
LAKCAKCGEPVSMPYLCRRCQKFYCAKHRLPESHDCTGIDNKQNIELRGAIHRDSVHNLLPEHNVRSDQNEGAGGAEYRFEYSYPNETSYSRQRAAKGNRAGFSRAEAVHLLVAIGLLVLLSLSQFFSVWSLASPTPFDLTYFIFITLILFLAFLPHELMHKAVAQKYGLFAEFRIVPSYALLTFMIILFSPFKIYAPGAVMIGGYASPRDYGKTAAAGPATNLVVGGVLFWVASIFPDYAPFFLLGAWFSGWLAFFNMIPVPPFDGEKVLRWNRVAFAVLMVGSLALFLSANFLYPIF